MGEAGYGGRMPSVAQADYGIKDVWAVNLEEEFRNMRQAVQKYRFVAMVG